MQFKQVINTEHLRRETLDGREYLVAPVTLMRAMRLNGGYVPREEIVRSAPAWNGVPVTLNHPSAKGDLVSANAPEVASETWLGRIFNAEPVDGGDQLDGEAWFDVEKATRLGGEAERAITRLENGDGLEVSTGYFAEQLEPGAYDGEHRDVVAGNLRPDHLAVLPSDTGVCSIAHGCGAGAPVANEGEDGSPPAVRMLVTGTTQADDPSNESDSGAGGEDLEEAFDRDVTENAFRRAYNALRAVFDGPEDVPADTGEHSTETRPAESGADTSHNMDRDSTIDYLVENHEFTRESLDGMGDECLTRTYRAFNEDDDDDDDDGGGDGGDGGSDADADADTTPDADYVTRDELGDVVSDAVSEALATNRETEQREQLVEEIVENSDEYDREALAETPIAVLENIRDDVATQGFGANRAGQRGAAAQSGSDDPEPVRVTAGSSEGDD